jgi:hypothetical protein
LECSARRALTISLTRGPRQTPCVVTAALALDVIDKHEHHATAGSEHEVLDAVAAEDRRVVRSEGVSFGPRLRCACASALLTRKPAGCPKRPQTQAGAADSNSAHHECCTWCAARHTTLFSQAIGLARHRGSPANRWVWMDARRAHSSRIRVVPSGLWTWRGRHVLFDRCRRGAHVLFSSSGSRDLPVRRLERQVPGSADVEQDRGRGAGEADQRTGGRERAAAFEQRKAWRSVQTRREASRRGWRVVPMPGGSERGSARRSSPAARSPRRPHAGRCGSETSVGMAKVALPTLQDRLVQWTLSSAARWPGCMSKNWTVPRSAPSVS